MSKKPGELLKDLIALAKDQGYVTYSQLNEAMPGDSTPSETIEWIMGELSDRGIGLRDDLGPITSHHD